MQIRYLVLGMTFAFAAAVQPGPLMAYLVSETMKKGWRSTLPAAFAPVFSDIPIATAIILLLSTVSDSLVLALHLGGGLFLLYLAWQAYRSWQKFDAMDLIAANPDKRTFFRAVGVNLLNPGPYLGWSLILGPLLLEGWESTPLNGMILVGGFYITMVLTLVVIIVLFGLARRLGSRISKALIGLSSLALATFGVYQLILGIRLLQML